MLINGLKFKLNDSVGRLYSLRLRPLNDLPLLISIAFSADSLFEYSIKRVPAFAIQTFFKNPQNE